MMTSPTDYEVLVIGGGPAGLSAALYLARFDRRVALFDAGQGRSSGGQTARNYLGFPGGVRARRLRELGYRQLEEYPQVEILTCEVERVERSGDRFQAWAGPGAYRAQAIILCTGVVDHFPAFAHWRDYVGRSMFWCITCDGYEAKGQRVVVIGSANDAAATALQLQRFTDRLTVLTNSEDCRITPEFQARLARARIPLIHDRIARVIGQDGFFTALILESGARLDLDQAFSQHAITPRVELARQLGVALADNGYILVDVEQRTNVPGVYAAGDVTRLHAHQVSTAIHEGGQAACSANYDLYPPDLKDE